MNQERHEWSSVSMFRLVGYSLLLFSLIDLLSVLLQVQLAAIPSIYQTLGAIVERFPLPLLGVMLIFSGETTFRQAWERKILRAMSWASLVVGILFLLLIPSILGISIQMSLQAEVEVNAQTDRQLTQLQKTETEISQATIQDLTAFLERLHQQSRTTPAVKDPQTLKERLLMEVTQSKQTIKQQAEMTRSNQRKSLLRDSTKWSFGALIAGVTFIYLWRFSRWSRRKQRVRAVVATED
jgi:hypothetical protein